MNVLVANNHLDAIGGSEIYTYTLIKALAQKENVNVEYFTFHKGVVSERIENELGVSFRSRKKYDLIIASHHPVVKRLYVYGPTVQVCHGTIVDLEHPSHLADYHVAVSKEVSDFLTSKGYANEVFLNGLDLEVKIPKKEINKEIKSVLSLSQSVEANEVLREICEEEDWNFTAFNKFINPTFYIEDVINQHDIVVGLGRSIYDAMACGRACVIYDQRDYNGNLGDGYLSPDQFERFSLFNCSGRYSRKVFSKEELKKEFLKYNHQDGRLLREIADAKLDVTKLADSFLVLMKGKKVRSYLLKRWLRSKIYNRFHSRSKINN